jgi:hypothetical protein
MARPAAICSSVLAVILTLLGVFWSSAQDSQPFNPVITSLSPASGARGTMMDAVLRGRDLSGGTIHISGIGVKVLDASVQDPATHFLRLYIDPDAQPGPRTLTIVVTFGRMTKIASTTFWVSP